MKYIDELTTQDNGPRLIPVSKQPERRLLSVFMALLESSASLRALFLGHCGCGIAKTASYTSHMEVTYNGSRYLDVRPDGLLHCKRGQSNWSAFVEAKAENGKIRTEQVQDYLQLADQLDVDAVITISNDFALRPSEPPYNIPKGKRRGKALYHFAWAEIRTLLELQRNDPKLSHSEQYLLDQCLKYFWDDSSGIKTFDAMPETWPAFVEASSTALGFNSNIKGFSEIVFGWQQERRDLCSKLTHRLDRKVVQRHRAGAYADEEARSTFDRKALAEDYTLLARYYLEEEKLALDVTADLRACRLTIGFDIPLPDKKGTKATVNWLCICLSKLDCPSDVQLLFDWPGNKDDMAISAKQLMADPDLAIARRKDAPRRIGFMLGLHSVRRFKSRKLFIEDLENLVFRAVDAGQKAGWIGS